MGIVRFIFAILALVALHAAAGASGPPLQGETLDKQKIDLRVKAKGKRAAIVFGFTKDSQAAMNAWTARLQREAGEPARFEVYTVANLQAAPFLVRGFIRSAMRGEVPKARHHRYLVMSSHEKEWKAHLGYQPAQADDAYLLVLDAEGNAEFRERVGGVAASDFALPEVLRRSVVQ